MTPENEQKLLDKLEEIRRDVHRIQFWVYPLLITALVGLVVYIVRGWS